MKTTLLTLIILLLPIFPLINCNFIYNYNFNKYNVYSNFNKPEIAKLEAANMLEYVQLKQSSLNQDFFSNEDIKHLYDVRITVIVFYSVLIIALVLFLKNFYKTARREKITIISQSIKSTLVIFALFLATSVLFFSQFLLLFHKIIFFYNDYWLLDPVSSNLIKFFPEEIFNNILFLYVGLIFFEVILLKISVIIANNKWKASSLEKK